MSSLDRPLDASNVATRLWVGGEPPFDVDLPRFDMLALCAQEIQPEQLAFHGEVVRCPIPDSALDIRQIKRAVLTARAVGNALLSGKSVLVTCGQGINRSALVAGLALARATRMTADDIIKLMRTRRNPNALFNVHFQDLLRRLVKR